MSDFQSLVSELSGVLPGLSPLLGEQYINRAWRDIRTSRLWSFLIDDAALLCPAQITTGACAITFNSLSVTMNAAASAALAAAITPPALTTLQIRFNASPPAGIGTNSQVYNIVAVDSTVPAAYVLTLDRVCVQPTNAASSFQIYRCYVTPPAADFLTWISVVDMTEGTNLYKNFTSANFDLMDPQRLSQGTAYRMGSYKGSRLTASLGQPVYELWPHPTTGQTFYTRYRRRGVDFTTPADTPPPVITDQLILTRALAAYAYPFAMTNVGYFPGMKAANWTNLIQLARQDYHGIPGVRPGLLHEAARQDDDTAQQSMISRGYSLRDRQRGGFAYPIDSAFLQSHLCSW